MSCYPNNSCNRNVLKSCSNTDVVVYTGENLTCTGIEYGDSLTVVLQKLDEKYCEILSIIENCSTTTTSSSTTITPTPTSCVSPFVKLLEILEPYVPQPNTIVLTPSNSNGFFGILIEKEFGSNPDDLTFALQLNRYSASNCTGTNFSYSFSTTLDAGDSSKFAGTVSEDPLFFGAKIVSLTVNGIPITASSQMITVNGTDYLIEGYNTCTSIF